MKLLIIGGTEAVRRTIADRLESAAHDTRMLTAAEPEDALVHAMLGLDAAVLLGGAGPAAGSSVVRAVQNANLQRLVLVSRRGAPDSRADEAAVARFTGARSILRVPHVYGAGDPLYGSLVTMIRSLPMLPVPDTGGRRLQPLAQEDLAEAIARVLAGVADSDEVLELAGADVTSLGDLLDRLERIVGRSPMHFPVPDSVLAAGMQLAASFGFEVSAGDNPLVALGGEDALPEGKPNALTDVLGVTPTGLDDGLRRMVEGIPEQLPADGVGSLRRRRWWVDIEHGSMDADELFAWFRAHFVECMTAAGVESVVEDGGTGTLDPGNSVTFELPLRGQVQVRVVEVSARRATIATLQGHPMAAAVMFGTTEFGTAVRYEVSSLERAASILDQVALAAGGAALRELTMESLVECVVRASGGEAADGVQWEEKELEGEEAAGAETLVDEIVRRAGA